MIKKDPIKCFLLDHGYTNQTSGPCCQIDDFRSLRDVNQNKLITNFSSLHQHPRYIQIKSRMDSGMWDPSCYKCQDVESNGLESMRLNHNRRYKNEYDDKGLVDLTIWTGRECNLQCRSCQPYCSSSWTQEFSKLSHDLTKEAIFSIENVKWIKEFSKYSSDEFKDVRNVILTGGEPLYNKECFPLLEMIGEQSAGNAVLVITTNCTIAMDFEKFSFLKKFRRINLNCSIDATDRAFEFIRTGGQWNKVVNNLRHYQTLGINLRYHLTHSALNIFEITSTRRWLEEQGISDCGLKTFVTNPAYLSYSIFTDKEKEKFQDWAKQEGFVSNDLYFLDKILSSNFDPTLRELFLQYMEHTKQFHGLDWQFHLPKLYHLMNP